MTSYIYCRIPFSFSGNPVQKEIVDWLEARHLSLNWISEFRDQVSSAKKLDFNIHGPEQSLAFEALWYSKPSWVIIATDYDADTLQQSCLVWFNPAHIETATLFKLTFGGQT